MGTNFIAYDEARAEKLRESLSKTFFQSPEAFVDLFNKGLISQNHPEIKRLAEELTDIFRDVKLQGKKLLLVSQSELYLNEAVQSLEKWLVVSRIKREVQQLVSEGKLSESSVIDFPTAEGVGYLHALDEDEEVARLGGEKLFAKEEQVREVFDRLSSLREQGAEDGVYRFHARDFLALDDSFVHDIHELLQHAPLRF